MLSAWLNVAVILVFVYKMRAMHLLNLRRVFVEMMKYLVAAFAMVVALYLMGMYQVSTVYKIVALALVYFVVCYCMRVDIMLICIDIVVSRFRVGAGKNKDCE